MDVKILNNARRALAAWDDVRGRAGRREFWLFVPVQVSALIVILALYRLTWLAFWLYALWFLTTVPAIITLAIRRLHDTGRSAWWLLLGAVPGIGWAILVLWFAAPTGRTLNRYGPPRSFVLAGR